MKITKEGAKERDSHPEGKEFKRWLKRMLFNTHKLSFQKFLIATSDVLTNLLIFDEIFESLDFKGVEAVSNCIEALFPESTCIYVITHNEKVKSMFNSIVKMELVDGNTVIADQGVI